MHPDLNIAVARSNQHEPRRRAEVGRKAAAFKPSEHRRIHLTMPSLKLSVPIEDRLILSLAPPPKSPGFKDYAPACGGVR